MNETCGCIRCRSERTSKIPLSQTWLIPLRYACEKCGNKRCPHHSDHNLECTASNEPGQPGSVYQ